jgi:glycosyltransferase involved in cell wall biosynthesis
MGGVTVAYSGVHTSYQIALAAQEAGMLNKFYCSVYDGPGLFGGRLASVLGHGRFASRRLDGLSTVKVEEYPWPLLCHQVSALFRHKSSRDWLVANERFDRHVAERLGRHDSNILVGFETCAMHSFQAAKKIGMTLVLDHPAIPASIWDENARRAANDLGLPEPPGRDSRQMAARKATELALADWVLAYSVFHRKSFVQIGVPETKLVEIPLWVDPRLWGRDAPLRSCDTGLRVLYVGAINFRKGVPYLLKAVEQCTSQIQLALVGSMAPEMMEPIRRFQKPLNVLSPQPKEKLRDIYNDHDVLVLPSLGDSWGFVATEAMACGLPVIVTENCGVPVPDAAWRVPIMDARAIAQRLELYAQDRRLRDQHADLAEKFATQFTPEKYRREVAMFLANSTMRC